jgi:DNA-binding NarL/FixJ family response regulator
MGDKITVVSVDDHGLISQAIRSLLAPHEEIEVVAQGSVGADVFTLVQQHRPNVLILDLSMPQSHDSPSERFRALPAIARLRKTHPDTAIIILSQHFVPVIIEGAIELGVQGYLLKGDNLSLDLPTAVMAVSRGGVSFSETVHRKLFSKPETPPNIGLTPRHLEVLTAIAARPDLSYAEQAGQLGITESTLKNHLTRAFKALDVPNITAAIICCARIGLISLDNGEFSRG